MPKSQRSFSKMTSAHNSAEYRTAADQLWSHPQSNKKGLLEIIEQWAATDPQGAIAWSLGLPAGSIRSGAMKTCLSSWARMDPTGSAAFAESLSGGRERRDAVAAVARQWA
ncbi:MAG TPA: hypothetical protein P5055_22100, partial [Candidatus Paceibacterota bacterium]|nr:hypothetical protein [Candidatus Paceibacterota bacterium]